MRFFIPFMTAARLPFCPQITSLVEQAATNKDPYFIAMVADTLYRVGRKEEAGQLARGLQKNQVRDGPYRDASIGK